jgi:hypothetical protein
MCGLNYLFWCPILVSLLSTHLAILPLLIFLFSRSVKLKKRFEEWQANFQSKYVVPRNEIFPPIALEWMQPDSSINTPLDDFPIKFSKSHLDFGNSGYPFRLNVTYKDSISLQLKRLVAKSKPTKGTHATMLALEDIGSDLKQSLLASASDKGVTVVFHTPRSHKFKLLMPSNEFLLTKGKEDTAEFDLMVFMTTQCAVPIAIEIPAWNMHTYIELNLVSELSPYIDFDEVKFDKTKMIGDGAFGTVYRGTYRNQQVAVKVLKIQELLPAFMDEYFREIDLLNKLRHPNIVQFVGASTVEGRLAILTEFIELGSAKNVSTLSHYTARANEHCSTWTMTSSSMYACALHWTLPKRFNSYIKTRSCTAMSSSRTYWYVTISPGLGRANITEGGLTRSQCACRREADRFWHFACHCRRISAKIHDGHRHTDLHGP